MPSLLPPGQHPRLLFSASDLPDLRARCATGLRAKLLKHLRRVCDALLTPGHPIHLDWQERKKPMWRSRMGIFAVMPSINCLSIAYAFTGETRYGDAARDAMMAIVENGCADNDSVAWGMKSYGWRRGYGHDKSIFAQCFCFMFDFCHDRLSDAQIKRLADYAVESIKFADEFRDFDAAQVTNNRGVRGLLTPAMYCMAFEGHLTIPDATERIERGAIALDKFLFLCFDADGAPYEGPGYAEGLVLQANYAQALARHGYPALFRNNRFERLPQYLTYELIPGGGACNNLNDAKWPSGSVAASVHAISQPNAGEIIPWLAYQLDFHPTRTLGQLDEKTELDEVAFAQDHALRYLLWWRDDMPAKTPLELGYPLSRLSQPRGVASLRTGWEANDWLLTHFCGRHELACHRQGDQNHVAFYALGERFLIDAGYGYQNEDQSKAKDPWYKRTDSHNCVLIDNHQQRGIIGEVPGWGEGEMLDFVHTPALDTTLGDASHLVGPEGRVRRALRRVVLAREAPVPFVAIVDVNEKNGEPFAADHLWHTHPDNRLEATDDGFIIRGTKNDCAAKVLWPAGNGERTIAIGEHCQRPQAKVSVRAPVSEVVTVFVPHTKGGVVPKFTCKRESQGQFVITCEAAGGKRCTLSLGATTVGPLRRGSAVSIV
jgi:hypothetical protein